MAPGAGATRTFGIMGLPCRTSRPSVIMGTYAADIADDIAEE